MENKYVNYIPDTHLISCIATLHRSYIKAKSNISKRNFYNNKVDKVMGRGLSRK
ncbi:MAG: Eco47II family restriction endonuclease [Polaribacter sp.]|nr:Eco47II family restriction endonuclease [Polaribacter sp.]